MKVGAGPGFSSSDIIRLSQSLPHFGDPANFVQLVATFTELTSNVQLRFQAAEKETSFFIKRLHDFIDSWSARVEDGDYFAQRFDSPTIRSQTAVNSTLALTRLHEDPTILLAWINYRTVEHLQDLAHPDWSSPLLSSEIGKRLLCCLVDMALRPD